MKVLSNAVGAWVVMSSTTILVNHLLNALALKRINPKILLAPTIFELQIALVSVATGQLLPQHATTAIMVTTLMKRLVKLLASRLNKVLPTVLKRNLNAKILAMLLTPSATLPLINAVRAIHPRILIVSTLLVIVKNNVARLARMVFVILPLVNVCHVILLARTLAALKAATRHALMAASTVVTSLTTLVSKAMVT